MLAEVADVAPLQAPRPSSRIYAGVAPLDASSGRQQRHRLNRSGNRQLNAALHMIALTQARIQAPAREYIARRRTEGKTGREAIRALKRHLIRTHLPPARRQRRTPPSIAVTTAADHTLHHIGVIRRVRLPAARRSAAWEPMVSVGKLSAGQAHYYLDQAEPHPSHGRRR